MMLSLVDRIQGYETIAAGNPDEALHKDRHFVEVTLTLVNWNLDDSEVTLTAVRHNPITRNFHLWLYTQPLSFQASSAETF